MERDESEVALNLLSAQLLALVCLQAAFSQATAAADASAQVEVSAAFAGPHSVLILSKPREEAVFTLPQKSLYQLSYTRKLARCATAECSLPAQDVTIRLAAPTPHHIGFYVNDDPESIPTPFLSPLTVTVNYE